MGFPIMVINVSYSGCSIWIYFMQLLEVAVLCFELVVVTQNLDTLWATRSFYLLARLLSHVCGLSACSKFCTGLDFQLMKISIVLPTLIELCTYTSWGAGLLCPIVTWIRGLKCTWQVTDTQYYWQSLVGAILNSGTSCLAF